MLSLNLDLGSASDCSKQILGNQKHYPDHFDAIEFLPVFLRHHFAGKLLIALQDVSCFLKLLVNNPLFSASSYLMYLSICS